MVSMHCALGLAIVQPSSERPHRLLIAPLEQGGRARPRRPPRANFRDP